MTLLLLCIGLLSAEGDEHKHQVRFFFCFRIYPRTCCLILQVAQDFGRLTSATGVLKCLTAK